MRFFLTSGSLDVWAKLGHDDYDELWPRLITMRSTWAEKA